MKVTGRLTRGKLQQAKSDFLASSSGPMIARAARVAELRKLVAAGRYKVEPMKLAQRILARALHDPEGK
jgi:anti-sigma28 factor (negative regulator of flagellin synthesis)